MTRSNPFENKRVLAFAQLKSKNTDWRHATVIDFKYNQRQGRKREMIEEWIPIYNIPEGYTNPYEVDVDFSTFKRCQLCGTKIIQYGIILNDEKKMFLIVGLECYEVYEGDSDREIKLQLLSKLKEERINEIMNEEKAKIASFLKSGTVKFNYRTYATITRNYWRAWSKTKLNNFLMKNIFLLDKCGYTPRMELGGIFQKKWKIKLAQNRLANQIYEKVGIIDTSSYRLYNFKDSLGYNIAKNIRNLSDLVSKAKNLDETVNELVNNFTLEKYTRISAPL